MFIVVTYYISETIVCLEYNAYICGMIRMIFILLLLASCSVLNSSKKDTDAMSVEILWPGSEDPMMLDDSTYYNVYDVYRTSYATGHIIHIVKTDCRLEDAVLIDSTVMRVDTLQRKVLFKNINDIR
jgi:hypothetical protein